MLVVSPIILGEIEYGILALEPGRQWRQLHEWFSHRVKNLSVLDVDAATASEWARLLAYLKKKATPMPIKDSLIAATVLRYDLTVATRNVADFAKTGVQIVNPFLEG